MASVVEAAPSPSGGASDARGSTARERRRRRALSARQANPGHRIARAASMRTATPVMDTRHAPKGGRRLRLAQLVAIPVAITELGTRTAGIEVSAPHPTVIEAPSDGTSLQCVCDAVSNIIYDVHHE